jgi:hypothetical protein
MTFDELIGSLDARGLRRGGRYLCPAHDDHQPSLSVTRGDDGRTLLHCFVGCDIKEIASALEIDVRDLFESGGVRDTIRGSTATSQHPTSPGCTLATYAERKKLPLEFLRGLGIVETTSHDSPAIGIPYTNTFGEEVSMRLRLSMDGDNRFVWRRGSKPCLYGLSRINAARASEAKVTLVEGESDCHTLWHHGFAAIGLPGASAWQDVRDAPHLEGFETIYVVIEPDAGGEAMLRWLSRSTIRDRVRLVRLRHADVSDLHVETSPEEFVAEYTAALGEAVPWGEREGESRRAARDLHWAECEGIASADDVLQLFARDLELLGVAGETSNAKVLYLAVTSRLLDHPISVVVKGPSSGGKSFLTRSVFGFFPDSALFAVTGMSERALLYIEEDLVHRMLVINEADGAAGEYLAYLLRSLLSEGRLNYHTVDKGPNGLRGKSIAREGPTGLILTTTATALHPENETRMVSLAVNDTAGQTAAVMRALARNAIPDVDMRPWHALQAWLEAGEHRVIIPFAETLATMILPVVVRLRRDFKFLLDLIRSNALLHQVHRERSVDQAIVATLDDYETARTLIADSISVAAEASVRPRIRRAVEAVRVLQGATEGVSVRAVASALRVDKSTASRDCRDAATSGYLVNNESLRGRPARYRTADPVPIESSLLPTREALAERCAVAVAPGGEVHAPAAVDIEGESSPAELTPAQQAEALQLAMDTLGATLGPGPMIDALRRRGTTWWGIARKLNESGYPAPGGHTQWNPAMAASMWPGESYRA